MDFGGFGEASWEGKSSQERTKSDPKTHRKNNEKSDAFWSVSGGGGKGRVLSREEDFRSLKR